MKKIIHKLIVLSAILLIIGKDLNAQKPYKDYYPFLISLGYITFNDDLFSNQVIENRHGIVYAATGYFKEHGYMRLGIEASYGNLKDSINIEGYDFGQSEQFRLKTWDVNFGYKKDFWKGFQITIYSGVNFLEFELEENEKYRIKFAIPLGLNLDWKYQLAKKPDYFIGAYINNSITYSTLYKANENFGKGYYAFEIGLGLAKRFKAK